MTAEQILCIDGQLVADDVTVDALFASGVDDEVKLFGSTAGWTALVATRRERYDRDTDELISATAQLWTHTATDVAALQSWVERRWNCWAWWQLLDAAHDRDPDLYRAWVPQRMVGDLDRSSLYPRDLTDGRDPLEAMVAHLQAAGWDILPDRLPARPAAARANRALGALLGRRYGWQAPIVVRVDDFGEVYPRLAAGDEVRGRSGLRELTDRKRDQDTQRRSRSRHWEPDEDTRGGSGETWHLLADRACAAGRPGRPVRRHRVRRS